MEIAAGRKEERGLKATRHCIIAEEEGYVGGVGRGSRRMFDDSSLLLF